jgi:hypothetical protein
MPSAAFRLCHTSARPGKADGDPVLAEIPACTVKMHSSCCWTRAGKLHDSLRLERRLHWHRSSRSALIYLHAFSVRLATQSGGSARDYLPGFAWLVGVVMAQRAIERSACLCIASP